MSFVRRSRRRGLTLVAAALLAGCSAGAQPRAVATDRCAPVELQQIQGGGHLIGDRQPPVAYNSTPPTSGWHSSGALDIDVRGDGNALTEPEQVSVLEAGGAVVAHGPLADAARDTLATLVRERFPERVAVTPYQPLAPDEVVFTVWGALQRCEALDTDALVAFVEAHAAPRPARPGEH